MRYVQGGRHDVVHPFIYNALSFCSKQKLIAQNDKILIAVSGGVDSCCLLHFFISIKAKLNLELEIIHFNHNTRLEDGGNLADYNFVAKLASLHNLKLHYFSNSFSQTNFQAEAHRWRRNTMLKVLKDNKLTKIATGQHQDDQVETLIMRLARGSSIFNLALKPIQGPFIKPLLETSKDKIIAYMLESKNEWREDSSNLSLDYTRNKIRNRVLPYLAQELSPDITAKLLVFLEDTMQLEAVISDLIKSINIESAALDLEQIESQAEIVIKEILRKWLNFNNLESNRAELNSIYLMISKPGLSKITLGTRIIEKTNKLLQII